MPFNSCGEFEIQDSRSFSLRRKEKYPLGTPPKEKKELVKRERISACLFETVTKLYVRI
jgi:hypothetical protein